MFAIGVAAIGLLGVMALVPVGLHEVGRGEVVERSSRLAMNAMEDFQTRGFANPNFWCRFDGTPVISTPPVAPPPPVLATWKQSFAIDPQFLAFHSYAGTAVPATCNVNLFPYELPSPVASQPRMWRITARPWPGLVVPTLAWADQLCLLSDELVLDIPGEKTLPPLQKYSLLSGASFPAAKRESEDKFSWMATLAPKLDTDGASPRDNYVLSVVIFHRRDATYSLVDGNENVVEISDFPGTGYRGGEVILSSNSPDALSVRRGNWLLLMGWLTAADGTSTPLFRWYRVLDADAAPGPGAGGTYAYDLDVTLHGADWPYSSMVLDSTTNTRRSFAVIVKNVVTVYEKTVQLEGESLHSFW
jgi:hypothetical protein